ncbi:MAG: KdsC family phosphatase [Sandaracinaceae bacterium]
MSSRSPFDDAPLDAGAAALAKRVELLALDVDGVLTDGRLYYGKRGERLKAFSARDGLGLKLVRRMGIEVAVITARKSRALARRLAELGIEHARVGREDKAAALLSITSELGVALDRVAYVGDDLPDLLVFERVGFPIAVADAHPVVRARAAWVTARSGGTGAVREACDAILRAKGELERAIDGYLDAHRSSDEPGAAG